MSRILVFVATAMAFVSSAGVAGAETSRLDTQPYSRPNGIDILGTMEAHSTSLGDPLVFRARAGETRVSIRVEDELGEGVHADVSVDRNGDGTVEPVRSFCGSSNRIAVRPRSLVVVQVLSRTCEDGSPSLASRGNVTATFYD